MTSGILSKCFLITPVVEGILSAEVDLWMLSIFELIILMMVTGRKVAYLIVRLTTSLQFHIAHVSNFDISRHLYRSFNFFLLLYRLLLGFIIAFGCGIIVASDEYIFLLFRIFA